MNEEMAQVKCNDLTEKKRKREMKTKTRKQINNK